MFPIRLTSLVLATACIAAAGAGGYIALRQNEVPAPAEAAAAPAADASPATAGPVEETEALVSDARTTPQTTPAPPTATESRVASAKRPEPRRAETPPSTASSGTARQAPRPAPDRARAEQAPPAPATVPAQEAVDPNAGPVAVEGQAALEPLPPAGPPEVLYEELVVSQNSVIGLQTEGRISSETARIEDQVEARVTRDVKVGDAIAIPAGSRAIGSVVQVQRGGKFKERARLGIRFSTLVLADGTRLTIGTDTIYRDGEAPGNSSAAKIGGGAVGGAILGAILGGAKGAAIGATAGAGGGVAAVEAGDRSEVSLPAGSPLTVRLVTPLAVTVERR